MTAESGACSSPRHPHRRFNDMTKNCIDKLVAGLSEGGRPAFDRLVSEIYPTLRTVARALLQNQPHDHPFEATDLIHEAYLRLVRYRDVRWRGQDHFFGAMTQTMRRVLIDHARAASALKRRGQHVSCDPLADVLGDTSAEERSEWADLLTRLARTHPRWAQVVECRCSLGFTIQETADALGVSHCTVSTDWGHAQQWLKAELTSSTEAIRHPRPRRAPPLPMTVEAIVAP